MVFLEVLNPAAPAFVWNRAKDWLLLIAGLTAPLLITLFIVQVNIGIHQTAFVAHPGGSVFTALLTDIEIFACYMFNVLLPANLSFFYAVDPIRSLADPREWLYGIAMLAFCGVLVWAAEARLRGLAAFGVLWFFAALGPTSNIAPIPFWMQDRYAYVSAAGLLLAFALAMTDCSSATKLHRWRNSRAWLSRR